MQSEKAILIHKIKYGDNGLVIKLLTKSGGKKAFLLQGLKGKNKSLLSLLHPLAILELDCYSSSKSSLQRIKEISSSEPLHSIRSDFYKNNLSFFIAEILLKSLPEEEPTPDLFQFIEVAIHLLENSMNFGNFHLVFLVKLSQFLGFYPQGSFNNREFFDLEAGLFTRLRPSHLNYLELNDARHLSHVIDRGFDFISELLNKQDRSYLLDALLKYYHLHLEGFGKLKTLEVIRELND